jgi:hypothetical protein
MLSESHGEAHQTGQASGPLPRCRRVSPRSALLPQSLGILIASRLAGNDARSATIMVGAAGCVGRVAGYTGRLENDGRGLPNRGRGFVRIGGCFLSRSVHSLRLLGADELSAGGC